jgi:hypothetical protein
MISQVIDRCFDLNSELIDTQDEKAPITKIEAVNKFRYRVGESNPSFLREREAS